MPDSSQITAEQLVALPDTEQRRELVAGVVRMMSPSGGRHGQIAHRLGRSLGNHVEPQGLGTVFAAETGFLLSRQPDTVRAPDVAFVRLDRLQALSDLRGFLPLAPDLVAEVISPSDRYSEVEEKSWSWIRHGVRVVMIVDPDNRTVRICRSPRDMVLLDETAELSADDVVPGWRMKLAELFA